MSAQDFMGHGLLAPLRRDGLGDFLAASGMDLIRSSIFTILGTQAQSEFTLGELPWRTEFGSLLPHLKHRNNDEMLQHLAETFVVQAVSSQEPRISVVGTQFASEKNTLNIKVNYSRIGSNVDGNRIFTTEPITL